MTEGAAALPVLWAVYADAGAAPQERPGVSRGRGLDGGIPVCGKPLPPSTHQLNRCFHAGSGGDCGASLNLTFSSNQDPKQCKSFCIYFLEPSRRVVYPSPLVLNRFVLPWRESAVHLDHSLQANLYFSAEAGVRRAAFISRSVEVRSQFAFAQPAQILTAVKTLCC